MISCNYTWLCSGTVNLISSSSTVFSMLTASFPPGALLSIRSSTLAYYILLDSTSGLKTQYCKMPFPPVDTRLGDNISAVFNHQQYVIFLHIQLLKKKKTDNRAMNLCCRTLLQTHTFSTDSLFTSLTSHLETCHNHPVSDVISVCHTNSVCFFLKLG